MTWSGFGLMRKELPGMGEAYSTLARFYDLCMEVDYGQWVDYLLVLCQRHGHVPGSIVDLGCGTGSITIPLAARGYELTGVDLSGEMIAQAEAKAAGAGLSIPFHTADLCQLRLPGPKFDTALSCCDVLNYLTTEEELKAAFSTVHELLNPGGLWLFDLNSQWKLSEIYGDNSYADLQSDFAYFWDNSYDPSSGVCTMDLTFFVRSEQGLYVRTTEQHRQRLWLPEQVEALCRETGFSYLGCCGFLTLDPPEPDCERWQFVLQKES